MAASATSYEKGIAAERQARRALESQSYSILAERYKTRDGEIDLVARKGDHIAFVEVKRRRTQSDAAYAIGKRQQIRISQAASHFLAEYNDLEHSTASFDVMLISSGEGCHHLENAFFAHA
jgi:putative endonuclease